MIEGEGTGEGVQTGAGTGQEKPAWMAQLPEPLRANETFTTFKSIGELGKSHLDLLGKLQSLEGEKEKYENRLANSIPKLSENATDEEKKAYYTAIGRPEKETEYEIPAPEGGEVDPRMVSWAQKTFYGANLTKDQAALIGKEWNGLVSNIVKQQREEGEKLKVEGEAKLRSEFKSDDEYKAGLELASRFWKKLTDTDFKEAMKEAETWKTPLFLRFIFKAAKATGEDVSLNPNPVGGLPKKEGIVYDKSPTLKK